VTVPDDGDCALAVIVDKRHCPTLGLVPPRRVNAHAEALEPCGRTTAHRVIAEGREQSRGARQSRELYRGDGSAARGLGERAAGMDDLARRWDAGDLEEFDELNVANDCERQIGHCHSIPHLDPRLLRLFSDPKSPRIR
jgi:hypothetical protein